MTAPASPFVDVLDHILPRVLGQEGALPDDWHEDATTYDLPRFHSERVFAERFRAAVERASVERIDDAARLRALLAECGLPYDYARLGQPLSTVYEIFVQALTGAAHVVSFASRTKPYLAVLEARQPHEAPARLYAEGTLPLSSAHKQRLRERGVAIHENWRGAPPDDAETLTVYVSEKPLARGESRVKADAFCFPVQDGGVLLIESAKIDVERIRVNRKRTAAALLAPDARAELHRLVGMPVPSAPRGTAESCDALLRELFPEVVRSLYFCTGLAAEAAVFSAVVEQLGPVSFFHAQNGYGGTSQLIAEILPRETALEPVPLPVLDQDAQGRTVTLVDRIIERLPTLGGKGACVFLEMPTNPELQVHDMPKLVSALRAYRAEHGVAIPVLVDTTLAPLYPLFSLPFARDWPFVCVKSGSKYFTRGKATLGVAFCGDDALSLAILERAHAFGQDADTFAKPSQLAAAEQGLSGLRPRMARVAAKAKELAVRIETAMKARGRTLTLYHASDEAIEHGLATGLISFYLPPAPTTADDLVDEFVDYLLAHAPTLFKNRVSYGQYGGTGKPDYVYVINPQESTQGALSAAAKAAQKRDNVQICRMSVSEFADIDAVGRAIESFFDMKYGTAR